MYVTQYVTKNDRDDLRVYLDDYPVLLLMTSLRL